MKAAFDVGGAETFVFANRGNTALLEGLENAAPGGVGDGMQQTIQGLIGISHGLAISRELMVVNVRNEGWEIFDMKARRHWVGLAVAPLPGWCT
jgi:hypothetical protein